MNILVSGLSGFIGSNFKNYVKSIRPELNIIPFHRNLIGKQGMIKAVFDQTNLVIHLAGKAHDLRNISSPDEYYMANTDLTKLLFDAFFKSEAEVFIMMSSVKVAADEIKGNLAEDAFANPVTHYGKSKLLAEQYILTKGIPLGKRVYILRPCMIHGPGNKGNLNLLYNLVSKGFPWPLGDFENRRSFCSIENLCFIMKELIERDDIPSGVYNIADDIPLSTNEVIRLIGESKGKETRILNLNKSFIYLLARLGDLLKLPLNTERLQKLTESYIVSNAKIKNALGQPLPISSKEGLMRTFESFSKK